MYVSQIVMIKGNIFNGKIEIDVKECKLNASNLIITCRTFMRDIKNV